ncbi:PAS domain-containing sensor histidine kinase [Cesiribacter sp. SM1]|uniref:PAS domain-containing sensor histidine kinase n=1 Tax=Cesiribacter sp. SM1 TaxID=2861196 RepID=UPI001CD5B0F2|nr:PAS domain-containing sensor histidine kinase [Cesiribacter sp. SM1]
MQNSDQPGYLRSLEQFAERTLQIIFSYDIEGNRFIYLSPAFEQVWKKSRSSVKANPSLLLDSIHPADKEYLQSEYQKIVSGEIKKDIEFRILLSDGSVRWLTLNAFIDDQALGKPLLTGSAEDKTEQKEKDEYTKKFTAKKNSILEILAHDLAGPLNNIKMASALIAEKSQVNEDPELAQMIAIISNTSERSIRLIREFVAHEFLETTTTHVIKKRVDIVEKFNEIIGEYKTSADHLGKTFSLQCSHEKIYLQVDDIKFRQVINNLISNALKFTPDGGQIALSVEDRQASVLFSIADNGIGIPARFHERLFDKFTNARRKGLKGEPSVGLGMSIVKTIVEWHGGSIWFESEENKGSTFYIELPKT